jgi:hypothetical protein
MDDYFDELQNAIGPERKKGPKRKPIPAPMRDAEKRTPLSPQAPAPRFNGVLKDRGPELTEAALKAWDARIQGVPLVDIAHELGTSIVLAKKLIQEVHEAIRDDLKDNLELNRQLDLERCDGLLNTFYAQARAGDTDSAAIVLRALQHRSKLTGVEPLPDPGRNHPTNVLVWIQGQMSGINKLVDSLPLEMPPGAP